VIGKKGGLCVNGLQRRHVEGTQMAVALPPRPPGKILKRQTYHFAPS